MTGMDNPTMPLQQIQFTLNRLFTASPFGRTRKAMLDISTKTGNALTARQDRLSSGSSDNVINAKLQKIRNADNRTCGAKMAAVHNKVNLATSGTNFDGSEASIRASELNIWGGKSFETMGHSHIYTSTTPLLHPIDVAKMGQIVRNAA